LQLGGAQWRFVRAAHEIVLEELAHSQAHKAGGVSIPSHASRTSWGISWINGNGNSKSHSSIATPGFRQGFASKNGN